MMKPRTALATLSVALVSACTVAPTVEYSVIRSPEDLRGDEIDAFFLQRSQIRIDPSDKKDPADAESPAVSVRSIPIESPDLRIAIRRADSLGVRTNLNVVKRPNTDLISEAGVEVIDSRLDTIAKVGSVITKIAAIAFDATPTLDSTALPKIISVDTLIKAAGVGQEGKSNIDAGNGVTIDFGAIPADASPIEKLPKNLVASGVIYSACRTAVVKFQYGTQKYSQLVKVADANYFERVAFPLKGKVSFHSECGVSVSSDKDSGISSNAALIEALATQGKAIRDAIEAAKKEKTAPAANTK